VFGGAIEEIRHQTSLNQTFLSNFKPILPYGETI
jgi:hypothetical protein